MENSVYITIGALVLAVLSAVPIVKFVWEPIQGFRIAKTNVHRSIKLYAREIGSPPPSSDTRAKEVSEAFRALSCDLTTAMEAVPMYNWLQKVGLVSPSPNEVSDAANRLMLLSNLIPVSEVGSYSQLIRIAASVEVLLRFKSTTFGGLASQLDQSANL